MKLTEFYNPEADRSATRDFDDTRKTKLTLLSLNKLRKYRVCIYYVFQSTRIRRGPINEISCCRL
jgi:hypothetical protein